MNNPKISTNAPVETRFTAVSEAEPVASQEEHPLIRGLGGSPTPETLVSNLRTQANNVMGSVAPLTLLAGTSFMDKMKTPDAWEAALLAFMCVDTYLIAGKVKPDIDGVTRTFTSIFAGGTALGIANVADPNPDNIFIWSINAILLAILLIMAHKDALKYRRSLAEVLWPWYEKSDEDEYEDDDTTPPPPAPRMPARVPQSPAPAGGTPPPSTGGMTNDPFPE